MRKIHLLCLALSLLVASPAGAYEIKISDDSKLNIGLLLQPSAQMAEDAAPDGKSWSKDFYLRRARIVLSGQVNKHLSFFFLTDQTYWGKAGDWDKPFFVQDAVLTFKLMDEFMVDVGLIKVPFTHHGNEAAPFLNALDFHSAMLKYPVGSHKTNRDNGLLLRGYVFEKRLTYRVGIFNGLQGAVLQRVDAADPTSAAIVWANPKDSPRFTGQLRYNILGLETGYSTKGIYFASEPIVSVGVSADYQDSLYLNRPALLDATGSVVRAARLHSYLAMGADIFAEIPFGSDQGVVAQATYVRYIDGKRSKNSGAGGFGQASYRWRWLGPVFSADYYHGVVDANDYLGLRGGVNFWIDKHDENVKVEFGLQKKGDLAEADFTKTATVQVQLRF